MIPNAVDGEAFYPPSRAMEKKGNVNEVDLVIVAVEIVAVEVVKQHKQ